MSTPAAVCRTCAGRRLEVARRETDLRSIARKAAKKGPTDHLLALLDAAKAHVVEARGVLREHESWCDGTVSS